MYAEIKQKIDNVKNNDLANQYGNLSSNSVNFPTIISIIIELLNISPKPSFEWIFLLFLIPIAKKNYAKY